MLDLGGEHLITGVYGRYSVAILRYCCSQSMLYLSDFYGVTSRGAPRRSHDGVKLPVSVMRSGCCLRAVATPSSDTHKQDHRANGYPPPSSPVAPHDTPRVVLWSSPAVFLSSRADTLP